MSELSERMAALKIALETACPARLVTRDYKDPAQRPNSELQQGVYTLLSMQEGGYTNSPGYVAQEGQQEILLIGDVLVAEGSAPSAVEDAEGEMIDEVKAFVRSDHDDGLCAVYLEQVIQSGQLYAPRGFVMCRMRYLP